MNKQAPNMTVTTISLDDARPQDLDREQPSSPLGAQTGEPRWFLIQTRDRDGGFGGGYFGPVTQHEFVLERSMWCSNTSDQEVRMGVAFNKALAVGCKGMGAGWEVPAQVVARVPESMRERVLTDDEGRWIASLFPQDDENGAGGEL
jgi:hypothetical protein